ncbi:trypsin-like peptidase domain-containing protein [Nocardia cyriacigeorgica]|uniref:trypsin-like peptidase domain-containing protein n=3 Tax=Nocardia cyriacigeorgica TaxID=135487 RepID=UPI0024584DAD|nr:trypsin-like peptidase domain-containing protein [Nocardia cyriacigeorgica]
MSAHREDGGICTDHHIPGYLGRILDSAQNAVGTCFQVAPGVLVTAWHVLEDLGSGEVGAPVAVDRLAGSGDAFEARVVATDPAHDIAILCSEGRLPLCAAGWSATSQVILNEPVVVTGVSQVDDPGHEYRHLDAPGKWAGQTLRDASVRLARVSTTSVLPGMSGAPVRLLSDDRVVGIVSGRYNSADNWLVHSVWVARSEDAAVLLGSAGGYEYAPADLGWVYSGGQGRHHFQRHALGLRHPAWRGDLYTGRHHAIRRILEHCELEEGTTSPLVVTGQPGSGKSSVIARALQTLTRLHQRGVAVHAKDAGCADIVNGIAQLCHIVANSSEQLVLRLAGLPPAKIVVVVDALDEMRTTQDRNESARLLCELSAIPGFRVVVSTRALAAGRQTEADAWRRSDLIFRLLAGVADEGAVLDLDSDEHFAPADLTGLVARILAGEGKVHSTTTPAAWQSYRADEQLRESIATLVQGRAGRNYLSAVLTADILASERSTVEPATYAAAARAVPNGIAEVLDKVLHRLSDSERARVWGLLVALSYGRGSGLTDARWVSFAHALGWARADQSDIDELRHGPVADYLLERVEKGGRLLTGLFHRSLTDYLRSNRDDARDESRLCDALVCEALDTSWRDGYVRRFLPSHVVAAGRSEEFLADPNFVTQCYPTSVWPVAMAAHTTRGNEPAAVVRLALPFMEGSDSYNALALEVTARIQGANELADGVQRVCAFQAAELECVQAFPSRVPARVFVQHRGSVRGAVTFTRASGSAVVVTTSGDGTARIWDPHDPELTQLAVFTGHTDWVGGVTTLPWPGRAHPVIVTTSGDGTARIWDPHDPELTQLAVFTGHRGRVRDITTMPGNDDRPLCVTSADDGTVQIWSPYELGDDGEPHLVSTYDAHSGGVQACAYIPSNSSAAVMVSVSSDYKAHVWIAEQTTLRSPRSEGHTGRVRAAVFLPTGTIQGELLITTSNDATARVWDVSGRRPTHISTFTGHSDWVRHVDLLPWPGSPHPVAVTAGGDGTIRIWDPLAPQEQELLHFDNFQQPVRTVRTANIQGSPLPLLLTACADRTVRLINPYSMEGAERTVLRHPDVVRSAIVFPAPDGSPFIAAATGNEIFVWDLNRDQNRPIRIFSGHTDWVRDLTAVEIDGQTRICSVGNDATVRLWSPWHSDNAEHGIGHGHTDWIWSVTAVDHGSGPLLATASADGTARLWRPQSPTHLQETCRLPLAATGLYVHADRDRIVVTTNRGFVVYRLRPAAADAP